MIVGIIGHGLIGRERAASLARLHAAGLPVERVLVADPHLDPASVVLPHEIFEWMPDVASLCARRPDWCIVATPHDVAAGIVPGLLQAGMHVLMEKPMGRSVAEARRLVAAQPASGRLWLGFNYRFFVGVNALLADVRAGWFGRLVSVSIVLGHGGAPGMERGWKFDPVKAGGGCLIDPGIHVLDLCRVMLPGAVSVVATTAWRGFWSTGIEEEAHVLLRAGEVSANLQVSVVRWRSRFSIEVHGTEGYGIVTGRGRSYGPQTYRRGRRWAWQSSGRNQAESEETVCTSDGGDSFDRELEALLTGSPMHGVAPCSAEEALAAMELHAACLAKLEGDPEAGRAP